MGLSANRVSVGAQPWDGGNSRWVALPSRQVFAIMCDESTVEVMMTMLARGDLQTFTFSGAIEGTWLPMPHV